MIGSETLRYGSFAHGSEHVGLEHFIASLSDHGAVVDAKSFVRGEQKRAAFFAHFGHHLLEAQIAAHTAYNQHFVRIAVRHGSFGYFDQHGEHGLLKRIAQILGRELVLLEQFGSSRFDKTQQAAERYVHAFDTIRQFEVFGALFGQLFDVVAGRRIVAQLETARKSVETIAHGYVDRFAEYSIAFVFVADHLSVAAAYVQHGRICRARY